MSVRGIFNMAGGSGGTPVEGTAGKIMLFDGSANDPISGGSGSESLNGGSGGDTLSDGQLQARTGTGGE